jgi:uncharacterized protein (TIGR00297 family)
MTGPAASLGVSEGVGLALAVLGAAVVAFTGQGTRAGAAAGLVVAVVSILGLGAGALLPLAVFVLGSGALTRLGQGRKEALGAAQSNRGRRDARHVAAKLGLPAVLGVAGIAGFPRETLAIAYAAALAGAFADTAATEVGPISGGDVFGWRGLRPTRLRHGEAGGMSVGGTSAALLGAGAVAWSAIAVGLLPGAGEAVTVGGAGFAATLVESAVAGTPVGRTLGHFGKNALVSVVAALIATVGTGRTHGGGLI